jgi:3-deoxy-D-arabino-heptulosonate 7-phosphate (DAHP) synthase class II
MNPSDLVKLIEILNPSNKPGRITIITWMEAENMRVIEILNPSNKPGRITIIN